LDTYGDKNYPGLQQPQVDEESHANDETRTDVQQPQVGDESRANLQQPQASAAVEGVHADDHLVMINMSCVIASNKLLSVNRSLDGMVMRISLFRCVERYRVKFGIPKTSNTIWSNLRSTIPAGERSKFPSKDAFDHYVREGAKLNFLCHTGKFLPLFSLIASSLTLAQPTRRYYICWLSSA
jgi:hypothetical protein